MYNKKKILTSLLTFLFNEIVKVQLNNKFNPK